MTLREFKNLEITGESQVLSSFIQTVSAQVSGGWRHATDLEQRIPGEEILTCFACSEAPGRPAAALWFAERNQGLYVSNIVPLNKGNLSYDEYNSVLDDFNEKLASPIAKQFGLRVTTTEGILRLENLLSASTFRALNAFSSSANRSTGSSHPMDAERWFEFVVRAHREDAPLSSHDLGRWLKHDGWDEDQAFTLTVEYEQYRELLRFYDRDRSR